MCQLVFGNLSSGAPQDNYAHCYAIRIFRRIRYTLDQRPIKIEVLIVPHPIISVNWAQSPN